MKVDKIDSGLLGVIALARREAQNVEYGPYGLTMALGAGEDDGPMLTAVLVRLAEKADPRAIERVGATVRTGRGRTATVTLPVTRLEQLSDLDAVEDISPGYYLRPQLDEAQAKTGVAAFRVNGGLSGAGVVIGVVDSGIDASHAAFRGRVHSIWDQWLPGPGAREGAIGAELSAANLQASVDETGHGTHVAGIAAGQHAQYGGVAPDATLVVVKTRRSTPQVAEGLRYIFRIAGELGRPAVVNLSLGGHGDPHDGSDALSQAIDEETGPGRIVCAAAGNDGKEGIHARRTIEPGGTVGIRFRVPPGSHIVVLNGWYAGTAELDFAIRSPSDVQTDWQGTITSGDPLRIYETPRTRVNVVTRDRNRRNGDRSIRTELLALHVGEGVAPGVWQLLVHNTGSDPARLDVWITDGGGQYAGFSGTSVDDTCLIGAPGAAARAITVGSYTTRVEWQDARGGVHRIGLAIDDISDFSSCGPLRNGAEKPDLVAPGAMIVSPRSAAADSDPYVQVGADCLVMQGTSMATPFVTGITALLLQRNPRMTPEDVKAQLKRRCQIPGKPLGAYDGRWGFGVIRL